MPRPNEDIRCELCDFWESEGGADDARCAVTSKIEKPMKHKSEWCGQHSDLPSEGQQ